MGRFWRVIYRGRDGELHPAARQNGSRRFDRNALALVKRSLHRRRLPFRVRKGVDPAVKQRERAKNAILKAARRHIGHTETSTNWSRLIRRWLKYTGWRIPQPWCAAWALSMLKAAGYPLGIVSAYVPAIEAWAREQRLWVTTPRPGYLAVFEFTGDDTPDHIGIVESVRRGDWVQTIEGNTSPGHGGSQADGHGVYRRDRPRLLLKGFIRTY